MLSDKRSYLDQSHICPTAVAPVFRPQTVQNEPLPPLQPGDIIPISGGQGKGSRALCASQCSM